MDTYFNKISALQQKTEIFTKLSKKGIKLVFSCLKSCLDNLLGGGREPFDWNLK